jgi:hypothetical protein
VIAACLDQPESDNKEWRMFHYALIRYGSELQSEPKVVEPVISVEIWSPFGRKSLTLGFVIPAVGQATDEPAVRNVETK